MFKDLKDNNMNIIKNIYPPPTHTKEVEILEMIYTVSEIKTHWIGLTTD